MSNNFISSIVDVPNIEEVTYVKSTIPENCLSTSILQGCGYNYFGYLGQNDEYPQSSPVQVGSTTDWKDVVTDTNHRAFMLKKDGTIWSMGSDSSGGLGLGTSNIHRSSPMQIGTSVNWKQIAIGTDQYFGIRHDGTLWGWGKQIVLGALGVPNPVGGSISSPIQIGTDVNWKFVTTGYQASLAIKNDGSLWSWGYNEMGQLGLGDIIDRSTPMQVGSLTDWKTVEIGYYHVLAIKTDGTLWGWGLHDSGQLGVGTSDVRIIYDYFNYTPSPIQIGTDTDWANISAGAQHNLALKTDGTLWSCGISGTGAGGIEPESIFNDMFFHQVDTNVWTSVSAGTGVSGGITSDGKVYTWGFNGDGQLGLGDTLPRSTPTQVGSHSTYEKVSCKGIATFFIKREMQ